MRSVSKFSAQRLMLASGAAAFCFMLSSVSQAQQNAPVDLAPVPYQSAAPMQMGAPDQNMGTGYEAPLDDTARLQNDVRDLTGQVERQQFEFNQLKSAYEKRIADLESRIQALESGSKPAVAATSDSPAVNPAQIEPSAADPTALEAPLATTAPALDPNAPAPANAPTMGTMGAIKPKPAPGVLAGIPNDPAAAYEESYSALKNGDYGVAEQGFKAFLANHPGHALATNAKYWLGETYFARKDYTQSARIFAEGYKTAPKGPKAADNLLKLGLSLAGQNKKPEACVALTQVGKDFPKGSSAVLSRASAEIKKLGCGV